MERLSKLVVGTGIPSIDDNLICPVISCGCEYVHLGALRSQKEGRGTSIEIDMWCEHGHAWTLKFQFHKGMTYFANIDARKADIDHLPEMWRS